MTITAASRMVYPIVRLTREASADGGRLPVTTMATAHAASILAALAGCLSVLPTRNVA